MASSNTPTAPGDDGAAMPKAITLAKSLADETPNVPILIGCEPRHSEEGEQWLSVVREDDETQVEECEETCTP